MALMVEGHCKEETIFSTVSLSPGIKNSRSSIYKTVVRQFRVLGIDGDNIYNIRNNDVKDESTAVIFP